MDVQKVVGLSYNLNSEGNLLGYTAAIGTLDKRTKETHLEKVVEFDKDLIKSFMKENKRAKFVGVLDSRATFVRHITLPFISKDRLEEIIRYEAQQNVPFPIEEISWGWRTINDLSEQNSPGTIKGNLYAVKTDIVNERFKDIKLDMLVSMYDGIAKLYSNRTKGKNTIIITTDDSCSTIIAPFGDSAKFSRSIPLSPTKDYSNGTENIEESQKHTASRVRAELARSFNFMRSQMNISPESIVFTDEKILNLLKDKTEDDKKQLLSLPAQYLPPFEEVGNDVDLTNRPLDKAIYATAGLVSWPDGCNLEDGSIKEQKSYDLAIKNFYVSLGKDIEKLGKIIRQLGEK